MTCRLPLLYKAAVVLLLLPILQLSVRTTSTTAARVLHAVMSPSSSPAASPATIVVAQDGSGQFTSVQDAVNSIPHSNSERVTIHIKSGVYTEKVVVSSPWITFQGDGADCTVIQWHDTAATAGSTLNSASVAVKGDHFTAKNIAFQNTAPMPEPGSRNGQAVALRIDGDYAAFYNVSFYGYQDTLYDHRGRHYFEDCFIQGTVDFIFGNGTSYYQNCKLHSVAPSKKTDFVGALTAHSRESATERSGFVFVNCRVSGIGGPIYLGRAWGAAARVVFAFTYFVDNIVNPLRWFDWVHPDCHDTIYFAEYNNTGCPTQVANDMVSADTSKMVPWAKKLDAQTSIPFLSTSFIDGDSWLHTT